MEAKCTELSARCHKFSPPLLPPDQPLQVRRGQGGMEHDGRFLRDEYLVEPLNLELLRSWLTVRAARKTVA